MALLIYGLLPLFLHSLLFAFLFTASHHRDMSLNEQEPDPLQNFQLGRGFIPNTDVVQEPMEVDLGLASASNTVEVSHLGRSTSIPLGNGFG